MVVLDVYSKNIKIKYKSFLLSKATFIAFLSVVISLVLPFIISYKTGGFWQKREEVYVQPNVKFEGEYLLMAYSNDNQKIIVCSSFSFHKTVLGFLDACSVIKVREIDLNYDGRIDDIHVELDIIVTRSIKLSSLYLILPIHFKLENPCAFQMQSAIVYSYNGNIFPSKISVYGDIQMVQSGPLVCSTTINDNYHTNAIIDEDNQNKDHYVLERIIENYSTRNMRTSLKNQITTINPIMEGKITVSLKMKYPEQKIYVIPRFWQVLKLAWIQYLAFYIIISYVMFRIKQYIFDNNLVMLYKERTDKNK